MKFARLSTLLAMLTLFVNAQSQNTYTLDGKLGLGTTPTKQLEVEGDSKVSGTLEVVDSTYLKGETEVFGHLILKTPEISSLQDASFI